MSNKPQSLNDKAWAKLFAQHSILSKVKRNGFYEISAKDINAFREARLMTKFDYKNSLPSLFKEHKLSILPITRGSYIISNFEAYHQLEEKNTDVHQVESPTNIQSIDFENITSEATALNVAYLSGILADFTNEEVLYPTVNGRMGSEEFSFTIHNTVSLQPNSVSVVNSQIEIDGGYEGPNSLTLIEAKNSLSNDFLIRQLYYPYRKWQKKIGKTVRAVFLTYTNGLFSLYEYKFLNPENYNSLKLIQQKNYTLEHDEIQLEDIININNRTEISYEPENIPFPQADSFERVINICELLYENGHLTREEITYRYDFNIRQTNYYTDACRYLGLVDKDRSYGEVRYFLTNKGKKVFELNIKNRKIFFVECILEKRVFSEALKEYLLNLQHPSTARIVDIMKVVEVKNIRSDHTFRRRASTISSWLNWILDLSR